MEDKREPPKVIIVANFLNGDQARCPQPIRRLAKHPMYIPAD
jgi:hypothetical protein